MFIITNLLYNKLKYIEFLLYFVINGVNCTYTCTLFPTAPIPSTHSFATQGVWQG